MCTRIFFNKNDYSLTSRTMDWNEDMQAQLYLMPKNISKKAMLMISMLYRGKVNTRL